LPRRGDASGVRATGTEQAADPGATAARAAIPPRKAGVTIALLTAAMTAFAANSLLCRAALADGHADAATFTLLRLGAGAAALVLLVRLGGARGAGLTAPLRLGSWPAALSLFAYALCFSLAYRWLTAGTGALLLFGAVQVTMLAAGLSAGERPGLRVWLGLTLALGGLVGLTFPGLTQPDPLGALLMAAAGVAWGVYSLIGRGRGAPLATNAANFARSVPPAILACGIASLLQAPHVTAAGVLLAVTSGAVTSGIGYAIWYAVLPRLRATQAAIVQLTVPPLAAFGGVATLGEATTLRLWAASAAILGGVALAVTAGQRPGRG
jgi:drug/metabolite transporter (DMT)-like permease